MILKRLEKQLQKHRGIKWYLSSQLRMVKASPDGEDQVSTPHFRSVCQTTTYPTQLTKQYLEATEKIKKSFLEYQREGSGWQLDEVIFII